MAELTEGEQSDHPKDSKGEKAPDSIASSKKAEIINTDQEPKSMEVHHHAHDPAAPHYKKNWKSYLWEFLMLFLAVTLGSYAESVRENFVHKEEVKTHLGSLIADLQTDVALFDSVADRSTYSSEMADSLVELLHSDIGNTMDIYFTARTVTANLGYGYCNSKSFDQMKSSGLLRYIKPKKLLDSIGSYYSSFQWLNNQTELMRLKLNEIHKSNGALFDSYVFSQMMKVQLTSFGGGRTIIGKPNIKPLLLSNDKRDINNVSLSYHYYSTTNKFYRRTLIELRSRAKSLIELMKTEYLVE